MKIIYLPSATKLRRLCFYTCLSFCPRGGGGAIPACIAGGIPACLAVGLQGGLLGGGVPGPGGRSALGEICSGGCVPTPVGVWAWRPPESRRLLLRTVHILLECILFFDFLFNYASDSEFPFYQACSSKFFKFENSFDHNHFITY